MTSIFAQGCVSMWVVKSSLPLNLKVYKACLWVNPTGYILYIFSSSPPLMLSGRSCFQIGTCFSELNFASTADSKASNVKLFDLPSSLKLNDLGFPWKRWNVLGSLKVSYLKKMDCISNLPLSLMYKWYTVSEPREHLHSRFLNPGRLFSSFSWMMVAKWMQRRHDECTAAMSTSALKESEGPSYFHLKDETKPAKSSSRDGGRRKKWVHIIFRWRLAPSTLVIDCMLWDFWQGISWTWQSTRHRKFPWYAKMNREKERTPEYLERQPPRE